VFKGGRKILNWKTIKNSGHPTLAERVKRTVLLNGSGSGEKITGGEGEDGRVTWGKKSAQ